MAGRDDHSLYHPCFLLLIVFAWALVNLDAVLCFLGKVLALFTPFLIGGAIAF